MGKGKKRANPGVSVDFRKVKHKVGKKLPKAQNETRTDFQARSINLPNQSITQDKTGAAVSERNLTLKVSVGRGCLGQSECASNPTSVAVTRHAARQQQHKQQPRQQHFCSHLYPLSLTQALLVQRTSYPCPMWSLRRPLPLVCVVRLGAGVSAGPPQHLHKA